MVVFNMRLLTYFLNNNNLNLLKYEFINCICKLFLIINKLKSIYYNYK